MIALPNPPVSSSARPLKLTMRPDLCVREHRYQGQATWVVKDPVGLKYFRFREEEYAMLRMLDGQTSLQTMQTRLEEAFPPLTVTLQEISGFVGALHQNGLVISRHAHQGQQLKKRRDGQRRREWLAMFSNILAMRWRGIDPDRLLAGMLPYLRWLFTPAALVGCIALGVAALLLIAVQWNTFQARLPAFHEFFAASNWIYLALALAVTKVLHEFGHGLCCRRFGGQCHEMGLMMLVFTPCLYCDVTDSWLLKSKWQRAAIGAAGMYVELVVASLATFIWWLSAPGLLNNLMLSVMFVCSISTVIFNANPLLRYDGYYILADLLEIPNLREKSAAFVARKLGSWCLGFQERRDRYLPRSQRLLFASYSLAAIVNRWMLVLMILWFLNDVLTPYGLKAIGQVLAILAVVGLVGQPLWALKKYLEVPGRIQEIHPPRLVATGAGLALVLFFVLVVPVPHRVYCPFEVQPHDAAQVYVEVAGSLREIYVRAGERVEAGTVLARLENLDAQLATARLQGQCDHLSARLQSLSRERHARDQGAHEADQQIAALRKSLLGVQQQLRERQQQLARLVLRSPRAGTVMAVPLREGTARVPGVLPTWSGTPLDQRNLGAWIDAGGEVCYVGDPNTVEAVLMVDQADVPLLSIGQEVLLGLTESAGATVRGRIGRISQTVAQGTSQRLSVRHGGGLDTRVDNTTGQLRPLSPAYQARVLLENDAGILRPGLCGDARISVISETMGTRIGHYWARTFNFEW